MENKANKVIKFTFREEEPEDDIEVYETASDSSYGKGKRGGGEKRNRKAASTKAKPRRKVIEDEIEDEEQEENNPDYDLPDAEVEALFVQNKIKDKAKTTRENKSYYYTDAAVEKLFKKNGVKDVPITYLPDSSMSEVLRAIEEQDRNEQAIEEQAIKEPSPVSAVGRIFVTEGEGSSRKRSVTKRADYIDDNIDDYIDDCNEDFAELAIHNNNNQIKHSSNNGSGNIVQEVIMITPTSFVNKEVIIIPDSECDEDEIIPSSHAGDVIVAESVYGDVMPAGDVIMPDVIPESVDGDVIIPAAEYSTLKALCAPTELGTIVSALFAPGQPVDQAKCVEWIANLAAEEARLAVNPPEAEAEAEAEAEEEAEAENTRAMVARKALMGRKAAAAERAARKLKKAATCKQNVAARLNKIN